MGDLPGDDTRETVNVLVSPRYRFGTYKTALRNPRHMQTAIFTKVFGERTLEKAFELSARVGYDAVELMCREPHFGVSTTDRRAKQLKSTLDDYGLEVAGLGTYTGRYVDVTEEQSEAEIADLERFL